jgi:hypothetical protein
MGMFLDYLSVVFDLSTKKADKKFEEIDDRLKKINATMIDTRKAVAGELNNILMSAGLAFLFTGMAIQKFFQGALTSIISTYMQVEGQQGAVSEGLYELQAAWEFFKFALFEALKETGIWDNFIKGITDFLKWLGDLPAPVLTFIAVLLVLGVVFGFIMSFVGQVMLFILGLLALWEFGLLPVLGIIVLIIAAVATLAMIWMSDMSLAEKILWSIVLVLTVIGIILLFTAGLPGLIVIAIAAVIAIILVFKDQIWLAMLTAGQAIGKFFISALNTAIKYINEIIRLMNKVPGVSIPLIKEIKGPDFSSQIAETTARIEANKTKSDSNSTSATTQGPTFNIQNINGVTDMDKFMTELNKKVNMSQGSVDKVI